MKKKLYHMWASEALRCVCLLYFTTFSLIPMYAQMAYASTGKMHASMLQTTDARITLQVKNEKLSTVLDRIEKLSNYVFVYSNDEINASQKVSVNAKEKAIADVLRELLQPLGIQYEMINDKIILKPTKVQSPLPEGGTRKEENRTIGNEVAAAVKKDIIISGRVTTEGGAGIEGVSV